MLFCMLVESAIRLTNKKTPVSMRQKTACVFWGCEGKRPRIARVAEFSQKPVTVSLSSRFYVLIVAPPRPSPRRPRTTMSRGMRLFGRTTCRLLSQVELGKTAEANKLGIFTDDSAKQEAGVRAWECFACYCCWKTKDGLDIDEGRDSERSREGASIAPLPKSRAVSVVPSGRREGGEAQVTGSGTELRQ